MTDYHEEVAERTRERLEALAAELRVLDERRAEIRRQQGQAAAVLKALGFEDRERVPIGERGALYGTSAEHLLLVSLDGQGTHIDPAWVERVKSWGHVFRTAEVMALVAPRSDRSGRALIHYLLEQGVIERQGKGKYRVVRRPEKPLPPIKDDTEPGPELRLVDGVVTAEPRPERGYGR